MRRGRAIFFLVVLLFFVSISTVVRLYTDLLWYREVGFESVFWTILGAKVILGAVFGLGFFLFTLVNLLIVARLMPAHRRPVDPDDPIERYRGAFLPYMRWIALGISAFLGLMFGISVTPNWDRILLALNQVPFGTLDPVFSRDVGFFVFRLPFFQFLYGWLFSGLIVVILLVAGAHYLTGGIRPQSPGDRVTPQVKAHLSALLGLGALLRAWGYRLEQFALLFSPRGEVTGASFTDINAERPALTLLVVISLIVAALFLVNVRQRGWMIPLAGVGLWLLVSILAKGAYPYVIERFTVVPAQLQQERPFIERNIQATRAAYDLEGIEVRDHPAELGVTEGILAANPDTVENIRLWDPETISKAYRQLQEIRTYYEFQDVDIDRYEIDGRRRQVLLSIRELQPQNIENPNWLNLHAVYTHGYGVVMSPTNESTAAGEPAFLLQDIPPGGRAEELAPEEAGVYFGEGLGGIPYVLVGTSQQELDYGTPEEVRFTNYEGEAGVRVSGLLRRFLFAWRFRDVNLAVTAIIQPESKILYNRHIKERLALTAPFLHYDGDPYPVVADGEITWLTDAYTVSSMYPYSERLNFGTRTLRRSIQGITLEPAITGIHNYIRNSVKTTIDSYDGTIKLYIWDEDDPVINAWAKIFPDLFTPASEMPDALRGHIRYPEDLFRVQTFLYRRYHMTDPRDFFTREDQWVIPRDPNLPGAQTGSVLDEIQPYYVLMRLPGEEQLEYLLILPMNPRGRPNMVAYMAAKSDPAEYGKLLDIRFPRGRQIDGVSQIHARINQQPEISTRITLLSQRGSQVILGNILVMPVGESILYVQPLFLQAEESPIPELKNVILATSERVVMGNFLEDTLRLLLEEGRVVVVDDDEEAPEPVGELPEQALRHLEAAQEAAQRGDWGTFGRELEAAMEVLRRATGEGG